MAKKIYEVFQTAADAYLEFRNNFLTKDCFTEFYELEEDEVNNLFDAAKEVIDQMCTWRAIDYYFNKLNNKKYTEQEIHW